MHLPDSEKYLKELHKLNFPPHILDYNRKISLKKDVILRQKAYTLSTINSGEYYPILKADPISDSSEKKSDVIKFILKDLPVPDPNTPWEQIIDFRKDDETRGRYLALINWVNEVSRSELSMNEISEKYDYLYHEYRQAYNRHKISSGLGVVEILAACGTAIASGNVGLIPGLVNNLFKIGTFSMNMLKEEGKIPGREISYMYHSKNVF